MAQEYRSVESILALDCGSTVTRALLIAQVDGMYRLVGQGQAPSTVNPPWNDISASARQAVEELTRVTGWRFLDDQGQIISPQSQAGGVDAVAAMTSAGGPLRVVLVGVMSDLSLASARRALVASCVDVQGVVSLDRRGDRGHVVNTDIEGQVRLIHELMPDAIVLVGGVDGGASVPILRSAEAVALACSLLASRARPPVVYAGNSELRQDVAEMIGSCAELRAVNNVRPSVEVENPVPLQAEIETLYRQLKLERAPGMATLADWSPVQVQSTPRAFAHSLQYLAHLDGINVLGIDVGGATTTLAAAIDEQFELVVRSDLGLSFHIDQLLEQAPVEAIQRWLPFEMDAVEIRNRIKNKALRPHTIPQSRRDLLVEQAVAREVMRLTLDDLRPVLPRGDSLLYKGLLPKFHLIVGSGGVLANAPAYGQAALMLLDGLQPVGVTGLALDKAGLVAPLGVTATLNPRAASQVMERDALITLGTVVAPVGSGRVGDVALTFKIEYEDGRALEVEVAYGSLEVIPLPAGQTATLELRPTHHFDVGLGTRGLAGTTKIEGGIIGVIIDARGRPLPIARDPEVQRERVQRWLWDMGS